MKKLKLPLIKRSLNDTSNKTTEARNIEECRSSICRNNNCWKPLSKSLPETSNFLHPAFKFTLKKNSPLKVISLGKFSMRKSYQSDRFTCQLLKLISRFDKLNTKHHFTTCQLPKFHAGTWAYLTPEYHDTRPC